MENLEHGTGKTKRAVMTSEVSMGAQAPPNEPPIVADGYRVSNQSFIPSFADASKLLSTPYSCLVMDTHRRHIALSPMYLKKKKSGIQEELNTELLKYSESLKGVLLAYDNIAILGPHGDICDDNGYVHMDIEARFVVFKPICGQKLLGKVNKLGPSHVGCLVHGCFNASIPKPNLVSVDTWRDAGPRIGADLEFEVFQIDADQVGVVLIKGRLERTTVQELLAIAESIESSIVEDQQLLADASPALEPNQEAPEDTPVKKKKKKKRDRQNEEGAGCSVTQELDPATADDACGQKTRSIVKKEQVVEAAMAAPVHVDTQELNRAVDSPQAVGSAKRKKRKEKRLKDENEDVEVTAPEHHCSDSSGYLSDKPSRKRKLDTVVELQPCSNGEPETPKLKKKRHSDIQQFA